jgi:hypothetical protein
MTSLKLFHEVQRIGRLITHFLQYSTLLVKTNQKLVGRLSYLSQSRRYADIVKISMQNRMSNFICYLHFWSYAAEGLRITVKLEG